MDATVLEACSPVFEQVEPVRMIRFTKVRFVMVPVGCKYTLTPIRSLLPGTQLLPNGPKLALSPDLLLPGLRPG